MNIIDIEQFAAIAYRRPLTNVFVGIESTTDDSTGPWAKLEGGPILACFHDICILLRQPLGRSHVEIMVLSLDEWATLAKREFPEAVTALMQVFETICYRKDLNDSPPSVSKVTVFQDHEAKSVGGIMLELSTGGSFGVDASSYGGLVWFLDGQASVFRREYVDAMLLQEKVIPKE
jgi:hypothetical protein